MAFRGTACRRNPLASASLVTFSLSLLEGLLARRHDYAKVYTLQWFYLHTLGVDMKSGTQFQCPKSRLDI
jgi:hypothetical protein